MEWKLYYLFIYFLFHTRWSCVKKEEIGKKRILDQFSMDRFFFVVVGFHEMYSIWEFIEKLMNFVFCYLIGKKNIFN